VPLPQTKYDMSFESVDDDEVELDDEKIRPIHPGTLQLMEWIVDNGGPEGFWEGIVARHSKDGCWLEWYIREGMEMCNALYIHDKYPRLNGDHDVPLTWTSTNYAPIVVHPNKKNKKNQTNGTAGRVPHGFGVDGDELMRERVSGMGLMDVLNEDQPIIKMKPQFAVPTLII
jgi:hypothetical protein